MVEEDDDGEPDIVFNDEDQELNIERFYFPITDYHYSSSQEPNFTYDWQNYPN